MQWLALLGAALLLSACSTTVPDIEACSGVEGFPGVAALCQSSNTDKRRRLTAAQWLDFLYTQAPRPDLKNPGKTLPAKGPAVCVSSDDWRKNETAIAELCAKGHCTYEQKKALERMQNFVSDAAKGGPSTK